MDSDLKNDEKKTLGTLGPLSSLSSSSTWELLTKGWVFLLAAIYGTGYVEVSIYHASLGLNEINPLRPKVAAAGVLFWALVAGATYLLYFARSLFPASLEFSSHFERRYFVFSCGSLGLLIFDVVASSSVLWVVRFNYDQQFGFWFLLALAVGTVTFLAGMLAVRNSPKRKWVVNWPFCLLCNSLCLALIIFSIPFKGAIGPQQFALFLGSAQYATAITLNQKSPSPLFRFNFWSSIIGTLILPFLTFGLWVYPHTRAAFGGGEPTVAEISVSPKNGTQPDTIAAEIVDETDSGVYIILPKDGRVRYMPRDSITSIVFAKPKGWF